MGVQTIGEAYQAGWRVYGEVRLGPAGGQEERARMLGKGGAGPAHADLDRRRRLPDHQLGGSVEVPDVRVAKSVSDF